MTQHHADFISSLFAERGRIRAEQGLLSKRMTAIDAVLLAYSASEEINQSTAASVSEPRSGMSMPGKDASWTVPQASHADNREVVTGPHRDSGETNSGATGGRQLQPALRTGVASGAVDTNTETPAPSPGSEAAVDDADAAPAGEAPSPVASPAPTSTRQRVKQLHDEHPEYTRREAWEALGITEGSLAGHSSHLGIRWAPQPEPVRFQRIEPLQEPIAPDETVTDVVQQRPRYYAKGTQFWLRDRDGQYLNRFCTAMTRVRKEAWTGTEAQVEGCRRAFDIARDLRDQPVEREGVQA